MDTCRSLLIVGCLMVFLVGCADNQPEEDKEFVTTPAPATPASTPASVETSPETEDGYPGPTDQTRTYPAPTSQHSEDGRSQTALESYELAVQVAKEEFSPDAQLYGIIPSDIMIGNLGGPPVLPGWFFKFKRPDSRRMFIVQIVDDIVTGTTLAESVQDVDQDEEPIDMSAVEVDSPQVFEQFNEYAEEHDISVGEDVAYDLELVDLGSTNGPVWSVVDPRTREWLYSVDATTGEQVPNPHSTQ